MAIVNGRESIAVTGTGALGAELRDVSKELTGYACAQLVATAVTATVKLQGTNDGGTTFTDIALVNMTSGATIDGGTGITAVGMYRGDVGGCDLYRWYCSAFTSQTAAYLWPTKRVG